jgi:NAD(P)-dependent dehydrogenase (short-subunit alcohol dehydrogenase family)
MQWIEGGNIVSDQKVALVTGVSSGIGRAIALLLSSRGFHVFGTARHPADSDSPTSNLELIEADVRDEESVKACVQSVLHHTGRIDVVINNAGYTLVGALEETSIQEAKQLFDTNFFGVLRVNKAVLPVMRKQESGRIINIGSMVGFLPAPYQGIYAASKHALEGYSESLDHEVRRFGIRVSVVGPGFTRTQIDKNALITHQRIEPYNTEREILLHAIESNNERGQEPDAVATVVLKSLESRLPRARYVVGRGAGFIVQMRKFAPAALFDRGLRRQFNLT